MGAMRILRATVRTRCAVQALAVALSACTGSGGPSDAAADPVSDDASADGAPDGCVDEAAYELGDTPLALAGCAADPAIVVIEVQLDTMQARGHVSTAPEATVTLTEESMRAALVGVCTGMPYGSQTFIASSGSLTVLSILPGDPYATGVFDSRTGQMVFSMAGDWMSPGDMRCSPEPVVDLIPGYGEAAEPASIFRLCIVEGLHATCSDPAPEIDGLNSRGDMWATTGHTCWIDRTYDEVWELARHTSFVGAMAACGPYDVFVMGLSGGGGALSGDEHDVRLVFVLAGRVDASVLP